MSQEGHVFLKAARVALSYGISHKEAVDMFRESLLTVALVQTKGNQSAAARLLKRHRNTLIRDMDKSHIRLATFKTRGE